MMIQIGVSEIRLSAYSLFKMVHSVLRVFIRTKFSGFAKIDSKVNAKYPKAAAAATVGKKWKNSALINVGTSVCNIISTFFEIPFCSKNY